MARSSLKPMKCKDLQFILPLYSDDVLSEAEQNAAEQHIDSCPVCRQKLADFQEIRNNFRAVSRPQFPAGAVHALRRQIAAAAEVKNPMFQPVGDRRRWADVWLMPFAVGSMSSLILGFTLLWIIVSHEVQPASAAYSGRTASNTTLLFPASPPVPLTSDLSPFEYASSRADFSRESPSINPNGSLIELTRDLAAEIEENDEVTVIADVYGNGSAMITEVVEPSSEHQAVAQLQRALGSNASAAAFVPASFDKRSEPMRVVLKIQNVSVNTGIQ